MTSPLHGGDREFESLRAHRFFFQSDTRILAEHGRCEEKKLHNSSAKLCNSETAYGKKSAEGIMTDRWYDEDGNMHIDMPLVRLLLKMGA